MKASSILLLSPFFYPEEISTGKYNTYLTEELVARGCKVKVIASHPLYPSWKPTRSETELPGVEIIRGGAWLRYPSSALIRRAILELWYTWHVLYSYVRKKENIDYVVPVFPPSLFFHVLSHFLPRKCRKVGIVHDLQGVYAGRSKGLVSQTINRIIRFVERRCFASCDKLIFLSHAMLKSAVSEYGLDESKCTVCYPFVALDESRAEEANALAGLFNSAQTNIVYSGALGDKQNPDSLLALLDKLLAVRADVDCHVFSSGPHFEHLSSESREHKSPVKFHGLVPAENLDELYARSDIQIIPQAPGTSDGSLPSKLPNLMAAGVPIFAICDTGSELAELVVEADAGRAVYTWEIEELVDVFGELLGKLKEEKREARRERLAGFVSKKFSVENVVDEVFKS